MLYNTRTNYNSVLWTSPYKFNSKPQVTLRDIIKIKATTDSKVNKRLITKWEK